MFRKHTLVRMRDAPCHPAARNPDGTPKSGRVVKVDIRGRGTRRYGVQFDEVLVYCSEKRLEGVEG